SSRSRHTSFSRDWSSDVCSSHLYRVKRESNDALRQRFVDVTVEQAEFLGLKIPDDKLKWNEETKHYEFGELPWDEFMEVLQGNEIGRASCRERVKQVGV